MPRQTTSGGIVFGDWKLIPMDANNWELAHRHAVRRGDNEGRVQWNRLGKYYHEHTIQNAVRYAVDYELKQRYRENEATFTQFIRDYEELADSLTEKVREAVGKAAV